MFVALSKFAVVNGMEQEVKTAFENRPHQVEKVSGFVRLDVISPIDKPNEIWLITYWLSQESYNIWHRSAEYRKSHQAMPEGLKLDPSVTEISFFEYVCS